MHFPITQTIEIVRYQRCKRRSFRPLGAHQKVTIFFGIIALNPGNRIPIFAALNLSSSTLLPSSEYQFSELISGSDELSSRDEILCGASLIALGSLPFEGEAATEVPRKGSLRFGRPPAPAA